MNIWWTTYANAWGNSSKEMWTEKGSLLRKFTGQYALFFWDKMFSLFFQEWINWNNTAVYTVTKPLVSIIKYYCYFIFVDLYHKFCATNKKNFSVYLDLTPLSGRW